jgi:phospholipase/carboxylesterase
MRRRDVLAAGLAALAAPALVHAAQEPRPAQKLDGPRLAAKETPAQWLVVLCHGSGGDGPDMFGLAPALQPFLPSAAFASPTGPYPREDVGYRWFPGALGDNPLAMVTRGVREGGPVFNAFLDAELARNRLGPDRLILLGFSQGSMMVLNAGLRRTSLPAAIIAFAGLQVATEGLPKFAGAPPILLIQGALDGTPSRVQATADTLKRAGLPVQSHVLPGLGHAIDQRGIKLAGDFMREVAQKKT